MIEGTRTYKGKNQPPSTEASTAEAPTKPSDAKVAAEPAMPTAQPTPNNGDAVNPERRKLFSQLLPMAGQGLVKILRESNLLKDELGNVIKKR